MSRIAFVTNNCPHYRVQTFEFLSQQYDIDFYFFSEGDEWYWQRQLGKYSGNFKYEELPGWTIGGNRITPQLFSKLYANNYDLYIKCINGKITLPGTYAIAQAKRKPFILWTGVWNRIDTLTQRLFFPAVRYIYRNSTSIVTYGSHINRYLISEGVAAEKIFATRHAVNNEEYNHPIPVEMIAQKRRELGFSDEKKIVLYVGRLIEDKGVDYLIQAFAQAQREDAVLLIVGTGSEAESLQRLVHRLRLDDRVRFVGFVSQQETPLYYALAWTLVLPSITTRTFKEPWGLVINEAFNQGIPAIASSAVGAAAGGLVQDGRTGLVVAERDVQALSEALTTMLTNDILRMEMSAAARKLIAQWSNQEMVKGFGEAIHYAVKAHSGGIPTPKPDLRLNPINASSHFNRVYSGEALKTKPNSSPESDTEKS